MFCDSARATFDVYNCFSRFPDNVRGTQAESN